LQDDFNELLRDACNKVQKEKFQILKRSRIFKGWKTDALIRLARMGRMKFIPRKSMVIEQGKSVGSVYFLRSGIAKVYKYPDRCAQLRRERITLLDELDQHRTMFSYHRSLKDSMIVQEKKNRPRGVTLARGQIKIQGGVGVEIKPEHITAAEIKQDDLERKILNNERMMAKILREEAKEKEMRQEERRKERRRKKKLARIMNGGGPTLSEDEVSDGESDEELVKRDEDKHVMDKEIEVLVAPSFFGGEALLGKGSEEGSIAMGSVVCDTSCTCLVVNKIMFQSFDITADFISNVSKRSVDHPKDIALKEEIVANRNWDKYKADQMMDIKKGKWVVGKKYGSVLKTLPGGKSVVEKSVDQ